MIRVPPILIAASLVCSLLGCSQSNDALKLRVDALEEQVRILQIENEQLNLLVSSQTIPVSCPTGALRFPANVERAMMGGPFHLPDSLVPKVEKMR